MREDERREAIAQRREAGESLESIAKSYGVTRERIRQILKRHELGAAGYARYLREQDAYLAGRAEARANDEKRHAKRWAAK